MVVWQNVVTEAVTLLAEAGVADPDLSATCIGQRATGAEGAEWLEALRAPVSERHLAAFDAMVERRRGGEPLQYVVAGWGFRYLDLFLDARVLIPRPETETIAGAAIAEVRRLALARPASAEGPVRVADLGTGSGAIGLSIAAECGPEIDRLDVWLTDVSADALAVARANLAGLGRSGGSVRLAEGDWFDALPGALRGGFNVLVSNPPYVADDDEIEPQVAVWEPPTALYADDSGTAHLRHLVETAADWLVDDGALILEMAPSHVDMLAAMAGERFAEVDILVDLADRQRGITARDPG